MFLSIDTTALTARLQRGSGLMLRPGAEGYERAKDPQMSYRDWLQRATGLCRYLEAVDARNVVIDGAV